MPAVMSCPCAYCPHPTQSLRTLSAGINGIKTVAENFHPETRPAPPTVDYTVTVGDEGGAWANGVRPYHT